MEATAQVDRAFRRAVDGLKGFFETRLDGRGAELVDVASSEFPEVPGRVVRQAVERTLEAERTAAAYALEAAERSLSAALAEPHSDLRMARVRGVLTRQRDRWTELEAAGEHRVLETLSERPWGRRP